LEIYEPNFPSLPFFFAIPFLDFIHFFVSSPFFAFNSATKGINSSFYPFVTNKKEIKITIKPFNWFELY